MRRAFLFAGLLPALLAGCSSSCIEDSGIHLQNKTIVKPFDKINVSGAIILQLHQDSSYAINLATDSALIKYIKIDVSNSQLNIKVKEHTYCGKDSIVVQAGIAALKELKADGSNKISGNGRINTGDLKLNLAGSSDLSLDLAAGSLTTSSDGTSKITLSGQAGSHTVEAKGIVEIDAFNFPSGIYKIGITGSGKANINVLNELSVNTEGSSEISYKGNPAKVDEKKSGAATLKKVN